MHYAPVSRQFGLQDLDAEPVRNSLIRRGNSTRNRDSDIAYYSGEAGGLVTVRESDALWQRDSLIRRGIPIRRRVRAAARLTM